MEQPLQKPEPPLHRLPRTVIILGFVSMFMDISSEMIHGLLPVYLVVGLGASMVSIGIIEGIAEATACIVKLFSGALSDRLGKRKLLITLGYGMAAFTKPIFPLASAIEWIIAARFIDRAGKGIRGAPRDALIADVTPAAQRGAAYGMRQSMDTAGAFLGPLLAIALMALSGNNFALVFWFAVIPGFVAFGLVGFQIREPVTAPSRTGEVRPPILWRVWRKLGNAYWGVVAVGAALTLARFSEAFLILRAQDLGLALALAPLVLVVMNGVYAACVYPIGKLSDRRDRTQLIAAGLVTLILGDVVLAYSEGLAMLGIGIALWGLHMGLTQGLLAAMVADTTPQHLRGTGFGFFNLISGLMMLAASIIGGALWQAFDASATFLAGAAFAVLSLTGLGMLRIYGAVK